MTDYEQQVTDALRRFGAREVQDMSAWFAFHSYAAQGRRTDEMPEQVAMNIIRDRKVAMIA